MSTQKLKIKFKKIDCTVRHLSLFFLLILNIYGKMEHKMLHNAPSFDLLSMILFWKKSKKIDHVSWIYTELIWNLTLTFTFMHMCMITLSANIFLNKGQKFLHFFYQINYKTVYWKIYIISANFFSCEL